MHVKISLGIFLSALLMIPACSRNEPRSTQAASEQRQNATDQMKNEQDAYVKSMNARLDEFDQKVDGLDKRASATSGDIKTDYDKFVDQLRDQRKDVSSKLDDLKGLKPEDWKAMRGDVDAAFADLDRSYNRVSEMIQTPATPKANTGR
jgi:hypothetical protein